MNREEIKERLIELCGEIFRDEGIDLGLIKYVDFYNDLGMDSISFISMIVSISMNESSISSCVNSGCLSARKSSSLKQRAT